MERSDVSGICEHYSHVLRSPLGVALGVLNDLVEGREVPQADLRDAQLALRRILEIANELRDLPKRRA